MNAYDIHSNGEQQVVSEAMPLIDEDLYNLAKQRVGDRFCLLMHWTVFAVTQFVLALINSLTSVINFDLQTLLDGVWFAVIILHTVYYFARITPYKVDREYRRLAMKKR